MDFDQPIRKVMHSLNFDNEQIENVICKLKAEYLFPDRADELAKQSPTNSKKDMRNSNEENRSTDRPQNPRECRHESYGDCMIHTGDYGGADYCKLCEDYRCPDYQPKENIDGEE